MSASNQWGAPPVHACVAFPPVHIAFDSSSLDFVATVQPHIIDAIRDFELPSLCLARPHEDPHVEAWLRLLDETAPGYSHVCARSVPRLTEMIDAESCPLLGRCLRRFWEALSDYLFAWPKAEPQREGLPRHVGAQTSSCLELELHSMRTLLVSLPPHAAKELQEGAAQHFWQVGLGWTFKLDTLYGLSVKDQPQRMMSVLGGDRLSMMNLNGEQVRELIACPFFRPEEMHIWEFAKSWWAEGGTDESITRELLWELLPSEARDVEDSRERPVSSQVPGHSFHRVGRRGDCTTGPFEEPSVLHSRVDNGALRFWNVAEEDVVVGASRQFIASDVPMVAGAGTFRLDLRILSGIEADAAQLFEVGLTANPDDAVQFKAEGPGTLRPHPIDDVTDSEVLPLFPLVAVPEIVMEGVRLVVEVDLAEGTARSRNVPANSLTMPDREHEMPTSMSAWLHARALRNAMRERPAGELDDLLFRKQADFLHDRIEGGTMLEGHAREVLNDKGARCLRDDTVPEEVERYHFYVVVPAGLEVEIY